jgi:hypothetical protein
MRVANATLFLFRKYQLQKKLQMKMSKAVV